MNRFDKFLLTLSFTGLLIGITAVSVMQYHDAHTDLATARINHTKAVCDLGHTDPFDAHEDECGQLQTETNTEYLCDITGTTCWLEAK